MVVMEEIVEEELKKRDKEIYNLQTRSDYHEKRVSVAECILKGHEILIDNIEQYSLWHSLQLGGMVKMKKHLCHTITEEISISRLELDIGPVNVDIAHRSSKQYIHRDGMLQKSVHVNFSCWYAGNEFYKERKKVKLLLKAGDLTKQKEMKLMPVIVYRVS